MSKDRENTNLEVLEGWAQRNKEDVCRNGDVRIALAIEHLSESVRRAAVVFEGLAVRWMTWKGAPK